MKIKTGQVVYCEKLGIYHKFTGDHVHDVRPLTLAESGYQDRIEELEARLYPNPLEGFEVHRKAREGDG